MKTLDMRFIRYLNLFEQITRIRTKNCFFYNNFVVFAVPSAFVARAIGEQGQNVKKMADIIGKRIKVVAIPAGIADARRFILSIISPIMVRNLEVTPNEVIITANKQSKAMLIGRNKTRLEELSDVVEQYFGKKLRIV